MSNVTLDQIVAAVVKAAPKGSTVEQQGQAVAAVIERMDRQQQSVREQRTRKATPKAQRQPKARPETSTSLVMTKSGRMMDSTDGTATIAQCERIRKASRVLGEQVHHVNTLRRLSMAEASDWYYDLAADMKAAGVRF